MKQNLTLLFGLLPSIICAQIIPLAPENISTNITKIVQVHYRNGLIKDGWISITTFENSPYPSNQINFYKGDKRANIYYNYFKNDSLFIEIKIDSSRIAGRNFEESRIYFNKYKQITRTETYLNQKSQLPQSFEKNIVYDSLGRIQSYEQLLPSYERGNNASDLITRFYIYYNHKNQVDSVIQTDSENISKVVYRFKYNHKGYISNKTVDWNDPDVILNDVMYWGKNRMDMYQIKYKYDRFGNWTKRYYVTKYDTYLDSKRRIKYK